VLDIVEVAKYTEDAAGDNTRDLQPRLVVTSEMNTKE
jgi:hypothetical protein